MTRKTIVIFNIFLFFFSVSLYAKDNLPAEQYSPFPGGESDFLFAGRDDVEKVNKDIFKSEEKESPIRRFEITFFISLPFVFIVNFLALHVYEVARQGDPNVSVWKEHGVLLPAATMGITTAISLREALICSEGIGDKSSREPRDNGVFFAFSKKY